MEMEMAMEMEMGMIRCHWPLTPLSNFRLISHHLFCRLIDEAMCNHSYLQRNGDDCIMNSCDSNLMSLPSPSPSPSPPPPSPSLPPSPSPILPSSRSLPPSPSPHHHHHHHHHHRTTHHHEPSQHEFTHHHHHQDIDVRCLTTYHHLHHNSQAYHNIFVRARHRVGTYRVGDGDGVSVFVICVVFVEMCSVYP